MTHAAKSDPGFRNVSELFDRLAGLLKSLGDVPPDRVRTDPFPGTATKRDLLRFHGRDDRRYELVDRTLVEKPMGFPESTVAMTLGRLIGNFVEEHDLGMIGGPDGLVELLPGLYRGPDVCFISWDKQPGRTVPPDPISKLVPDLAVEVLSPKNTRAEISRKLKEYFLAGVTLVWVVDPTKRVAAVHTAPDVKTTLDASAVLDGGDVLPGFRLPLAKLFERLGPPAAAKKPRKKK